MPSYAELETESWWTAEVEPTPLAAFNTRLRAKFGHTRNQTGSKGDNRHLRGRHRSRNWCLLSQYCTLRSYGTTDPRDKQGDGSWLRATDVGLTGAALRQASARLDAAVKAGRLPLVAEWFGTVDGRTVTGWFQGHVSSSDDSHLYHLHLGYWTGLCGNADQFALLGDIITGEDDMQLTDKLTAFGQDTTFGGAIATLLARTDFLANRLGLVARLDAILAAAQDDGNTTVTLDPAALAELAAVRTAVADLKVEVRDAVADLGEGGAAAVRADA